MAKPMLKEGEKGMPDTFRTEVVDGTASIMDQD